MQLFYAPDISADHYSLSEEESAHCSKVLRSKVGDILTLTDGKGGRFEGRIVSIDRKSTVVEIVNREIVEREFPDLIVACAPTKNIDRFEWFVEKSVEVGCKGIVPLLCDHSERRVIKEERLKKIAVSAMKQSLKFTLTEVEPMCGFDDFITRDFGDAIKAIAHCDPSEDKRLLKDVVEKGRPCVVLIGPEGDFSDEEVAKAKKAGFKSVSLGESRLRTETAALSAVMTVSLINQ